MIARGAAQADIGQQAVVECGEGGLGAGLRALALKGVNGRPQKARRPAQDFRRKFEGPGGAGKAAKGDVHGGGHGVMVSGGSSNV